MMDDWVVFGHENGTRIDLMFNEVGEVQISILQTLTSKPCATMSMMLHAGGNLAFPITG
jgi:hypothetical protein